MSKNASNGENMHLLIIDDRVAYIQKRMASKFPELVIHGANDESEVGDFAEKADILLAIKVSDELLRRAKRLKWVQSMITGVDFFLNLPSLRKDVLLTSSRGMHGPQMSELTLLLMLALNRRFQDNVLNQKKKIWERWPGTLLWQKKVAILGIGVIGQAIAEKCKAFGMTVYGIDPVKREVQAVDHFLGPEELAGVLGEVDYFVNVVPFTPETKRMVGAKEFSAMKPTAFYISVGRGDTVDEEALIEALRTGKIAGAAMDVFSTTPLPKESPLWDMKNVIMTPHIGGLSDVYIDQMLPIFEENLRRFLQGERRNLVNLIER
ncbi:MAG TPA: D-2-hydroxyacid dehydrogenase [Desulfatiglandales bacterium]|nr:D-2-hydroxyacid dehydrogenase [Desulfatiglandales bacterium]